MAEKTSSTIQFKSFQFIDQLMALKGQKEDHKTKEAKNMHNIHI